MPESSYGTDEEFSYGKLLREISPEIKVLSEETVESIRKKLESMPGLYDCLARFMLAAYPYSGLRRSELRRARISDLDVNHWTILVAHPKGEINWASAQSTVILQPARTDVQEFLRRREEYLSSYGIEECEALVPHISESGKVGHWTDGMWGKIKADAEKCSGTRFRIQELRATFGQICKDRGASIESVSRALRHRTTKTTELYYTRIKAEDAFRELERAYESTHRKNGDVPNPPD
ncbi:MAG: site-specific integrase [Euryarchaeota archaeon]|nr:site-specific integrase [Euryarchaeota archaeon]